MNARNNVSSRVDVDGLCFEVSVRAGRRSGRPLFLFNGIRMESGVFCDLRERMSDHTTITCDFPPKWHALCPWPLGFLWPLVCPGPLMSTIADTIARLIRKLGFLEVDVLGYSWGGAAAFEMAWRHPELVRAIIFVATVPEPMSLLNNPTTRQSFIEGNYGGAIMSDPNREELFRKQFRLAHHTSNYYRGAALNGWSSHSRLGRFSRPTLVVAGTKDRITPLCEVRKLLKIPGAQSLSLDDGHLLVHSSAHGVAAGTLAFLKSLSLREPLPLKA